MSGDASDEIGSVIGGAGDPVATLHADGTWRTPGDPGLAAGLSAFLDDYPGPQGGAYGVKLLHQAAGILGGTVRLEERASPDDRDQVIY